MTSFTTTFIKEFSTEWQMAHLYEHAILKLISGGIDGNGYDINDDGYASATTYHMGFIELTVTIRSRRVLKKLHKLIDTPVLPDALIEQSVAEIESELGSEQTYKMDELKPELLKLSGEDWIELKDYEFRNFGVNQPEQPSRFLIPGKKSKPQTITVSLGVSFKPNEKSADLILSPFIFGFILSKFALSLSRKYGTYMIDVKNPLRNMRSLFAESTISSLKPIDKDKVEGELVKAISSFASDNHKMKKIADTLLDEYYVTSVARYTMIEEYFSQANILIGKKHLKNLRKPNVIKAIVEGLEFKVAIK